LAGAARADPFTDGDAAFQSGDYATALKDWLPLAEAGNAAAQNNIGTMYHNGQGVPQSDAIADQWLTKAANGGNADAQYSLGLAYGSGAGVAQDLAQAAAWYRRSATQGNPAAQASLGVAYLEGQGVAQSNLDAYVWLALGAAGFAKTDAQLAAEAGQWRDKAGAMLTPAQMAAATSQVAAFKPN
jgi:TPR repeat protein